MTRFMHLSNWPAVLLCGIAVAGCAPQTDYSAVSTSPVAMACDGGRTFTVSYANGFETAIIETDGRRLELPRVRTASSLSPSSSGFGGRSIEQPSFGATDTRLFGDRFGDRETFGRPRGGLGAAGTTGVRYGSDEAFFISRNQEAVLEVGDEIYSNCRVARA